jgi:signal transduction histidine kinase
MKFIAGFLINFLIKQTRFVIRFYPLSGLSKKEFLYSCLRILSWGVVYYLVAWFSLDYLLYSNGVAIAWPPVGIFISAILLTPARQRPYLVALLFAADVIADFHTGISFMAKIAYGLLSTGDALISAWVMLRFISNPFSFSKVRNFLLYLLYSVILCHGFFSILVSGVNTYTQGSEYWPGILSTWVADGVGNIMIVPFIISWASFSRIDLKNLSVPRMIEIVMLVIALVASNILLFPYSRDGFLFSFIINYLSFPFIIWAIFRFDLKIVTLALMLVTLVMFVSLLNVVSFLNAGNADLHFLFFQLYIVSVSIIAILVTCVLTERNEARIELMQNINLLMEAEKKLVLNSIEIEERERGRYSRELHDGLGPLLSTIKMYMQSLSGSSKSEKVKFIAEESERNIKIAIQTMREVAHGLSPFNLSNFGYVNAVLEFTKGINKIHDLVIDFEYNSHARFNDFYEIILYRITTELISNTLKHAQATHVEIAFNYSYEKRNITLVYSDNGTGFDASCNDSKKGMGLMNIHQRINILGGHFKIESVIGKGCTIFVDFPLNEANDHMQSLGFQGAI